jgi:chromosome segregation ATPase
MPLPFTERARGLTKAAEHWSKNTLKWWERIFGRSKHNQILERLDNMADTLEQLEGKLAAVETGLTDVGTKLDEGLGEVTAEITKLREQLATVQLPAGAQARLDAITSKTAALQAVAKTLADIIPNAVPPPVA